MRNQDVLKLIKEIAFFKPFTAGEKKTLANLDSHIIEHKKENLSVIKNIFGLDSIKLQQDATEDHLELVA